MSEASEMVADELLAPWRPMSEAPRDGTPILALLNDCSGVQAIGWGVPDDNPLDTLMPIEQWFKFKGNIGDWAESAADGDDDGWYYGWVPVPKMRVRVRAGSDKRAA